MTDITFMVNGREAMLTTNHATSSYGQAVLLIDGQPVGQKDFIGGVAADKVVRVAGNEQFGRTTTAYREIVAWCRSYKAGRGPVRSGRPHKLSVTVTIEPALLERAREAGLNLSGVLEEALEARLKGK